MLHESIKLHEFIVKETDGFRMRVEKYEALSPKGLYSLTFIRESLKNKKVIGSQTYNFLMTRDDIKKLCQGLLDEQTYN